jgi:hypothetical protein
MIDDGTKFNRRYILKVETQPRVPGSNKPGDAAFATIELPIACEFHIVRNSMASANTATFRIFNLAQRSRDKIYKDKYRDLEYRAIQFWAGYSDQPPMVFNGNVSQALSYKQSGAKDVVTEIEAYEGAYAMVNGFSSQTLAGGQTYAQILQTLSNDLPYLDNPEIGDIQGNARRGAVLFGNTWKLVQQYSGGNATIDNNRLLVLKPNECVKGDILVINSDTGLLGSPFRTNAMIQFETMFTPQIKVNQIIRLESSVNKYVNGFYKVMGFEHSGIISNTVGGSARTVIQLWLGEQALRTI